MELSSSSGAPAHRVGLLYGGDPAYLEDPPDFLDLGEIRELCLIPSPASTSRLLSLALPHGASPPSRRFHCRRRCHEELYIVPGATALKRRRLLSTNVETPEEVLCEGAVRAKEGVFVPHRPHELLPPNLVRLAFLQEEEQGGTGLGAFLLRQLDERQVCERELPAALATEDELVPCEDVEPRPKALGESG